MCRAVRAELARLAARARLAPIGDVDGVESICAQLPIAPSTYYAPKAQQRDPARRSVRAQHDATLGVEIRRV